MQNVFSKLSTKTLALLLLVLPAMTSCDKCKDDDKPSDKAQFVGEWEIKSFTIDGVEVKGSVITSSKMEFEAYTGNNGDFEWTIQFADGTNETQSGDYEVDEADQEIEFENEEIEKPGRDTSNNEQDNITEKIESSVKFGVRPKISLILSNSCGNKPSFFAVSTVGSDSSIAIS